MYIIYSFISRLLGCSRTEQTHATRYVGKLIAGNSCRALGQAVTAHYAAQPTHNCLTLTLEYPVRAKV